jgi:hypothetical protein
LERAGERLAIQEKYDAEGTKKHTNGSLKLGIILTSQCSGSGWLVSSLDTRPGVIWQNEMLIDFSLNETKWQTVSWWEKYRTDLEQALSLADAHDHDDVEMIGFKLMYDQLPQHLYAEFANWLYEKQVHVIHLRQRCAAIAFASQIVKAQRLQLVKVVDHFSSKEKVDALPDVPKPSFRDDLGLARVKTLEKNQVNFANYLRLTNAPIFEVTYEDLDGIHQAKWFHALLGFLELSSQEKIQKSDMIKVGSKLCEDRIDGLGDGYETLVGLQSHLECIKLRAVEGNSSMPDLFFPPQNGQCRLTPHCNQHTYIGELKALYKHYSPNASATLP